MTTYYGHTHKLGKAYWQTLRDHAFNVALRAGTHAEAFSETDRAFLMGVFHDLGKYGDLFQQRLNGVGSGLDHWSIGAIAMKRAKDTALTLCIQGHHIGLQQGNGAALDDLNVRNLTEKHPFELRLTEPDLSVLMSRLQADGFKNGSSRVSGS